MKQIRMVPFALIVAAISVSASTNAQSNRWEDSSYYNRNRPAFNSTLDIQKERWNQEAAYLLRGQGDTVQPYTYSEWVRDSMMLETRNWDNASAALPPNFKNIPVYDPNRNYKLDSAGRNRAGRSQDRKFPARRVEAYNGTENGAALSGGGTRTSMAKDTPGKHTGQDFVYMEDGRLMVSRSGIKTRVAESVTLEDGTVILSDGGAKTKDGKVLKLGEGDRVNLFEKDFHVIRANKE